WCVEYEKGALCECKVFVCVKDMYTKQERIVMVIREAQTMVKQELAKHHDTMIQFLRDIVAIPSFDSQIGPVGDAIGARMIELGFDEVRRDSMGNILGRIRSEERRVGKECRSRWSE